MSIQEAIDRTKVQFAEQIEIARKEQGLSIRELASKTESKLHHPQILRVTQCKSYRVDTILDIMDVLGLEFEIREKK